MDFINYLTFAARRLQEAENQRDTEEWIRLANVLIDILRKNIHRLETPDNNETGRKRKGRNDRKALDKISELL